MRDINASQLRVASALSPLDSNDFWWLLEQQKPKQHWHQYEVILKDLERCHLLESLLKKTTADSFNWLEQKRLLGTPEVSTKPRELACWEHDLETRCLEQLEQTLSVSEPKRFLNLAPDLVCYLT